MTMWDPAGIWPPPMDGVCAQRAGGGSFKKRPSGVLPAHGDLCGELGTLDLFAGEEGSARVRGGLAQGEALLQGGQAEAALGEGFLVFTPALHPELLEKARERGGAPALVTGEREGLCAQRPGHYLLRRERL